MNIVASKFALAATYTVAILWVICSIILLAIPGISMRASGYMMHGDFSAMQWQMHFTSFLVGLILWSVVAGLFAWLLAVIYNKML